MNEYIVYAQRLAWAGKRRNYETLADEDAYELILDRRGVVKAPTIELALKEAKSQKYFAPILDPGRKDLQ